MQPGKAKRLRPAARLETGKGGQTLKKALVTGICGFIGSHLACALASHGMQVTGVDVRCESLNPELMKLIENGTVTVHKGDLLGFDFSSLGRFDYVYQVAGKVSAWGDLADFDRVNVDGTRRVIDYAKAAGSRVFVYLSSVAVYGYRGYRDLPEEGEKKPMDNPYSLSKLHAETMVAEHCREIGLHYLVIRPGNVYGEYDMTSSYDLYRLVSKGKMAVVDRGRHLSCFVYAGNLAEGIYRASVTESAYDEDYNLTDGGGETLAEYLACAAEALGVKPRFFSLPAPLSIFTARCIEGVYRLERSRTMPLITLFSVEQNCRDYHFSIEKARSRFGYDPAVDMREATRRTAAWYRSMPDNIKVKRG